MAMGKGVTAAPPKDPDSVGLFSAVPAAVPDTWRPDSVERTGDPSMKAPETGRRALIDVARSGSGSSPRRVTSLLVVTRSY